MSTFINRDLPNDEYQAAVGANNPSSVNVFATIADIIAGSGGIQHGVASGTNTYTVTIPGVIAYTDGDAYLVRFTNGSAANSTININSLGVKILTKKANVQVTGGDIVAGQEMLIIYDGTNFQCIQTTANQLFAYVTNDDSVTITAGQPVYAFGAAGNRMSVKLANNTGDSTSAQTVGLVFSSSIAPNQRGFVITQGVIDGLDTSMYSPGDQLYLGAAAGALTNVKPYAPNHLVYIGIVERANAGNGQIYVKPQNGYELDELHDVDLISNPPTDGQVLTYDGTSGLWINEDLPAIQGASINPSLDPVIENTITDPSIIDPEFGDSYLVPIGAIGTWSGQDNNIATSDGTDWVYYTPSLGDITAVLTGINAGNVYEFDSVNWIVVATTSTTATPFFLAGSSVDAGGNKIANIARAGRVILGSNSGPLYNAPLTVRASTVTENLFTRAQFCSTYNAALVNTWYRVAFISINNTRSGAYKILFSEHIRGGLDSFSAIIDIAADKTGTGNIKAKVTVISTTQGYTLTEDNFKIYKNAFPALGPLTIGIYYRPTIVNAQSNFTLLNALTTDTQTGVRWYNTNLGATITDPISDPTNRAIVVQYGIKNNYTAIVDPTVTDGFNLNYWVGSEWVNTVTKKSYICTDSTGGAAVWTETTNAAAFNQQIQDEGSNLTQRDIINFVGNGVTATDNGTNTVVTVPGVTTQSFFDQFMVNQYSYFLPSDNSALFDTLRAGGSLTSVGTTTSLTENPMGVLFTTPTAVSSVAALFGNTFGGSILGVNFQFETHRRFRINTANPAQRLFIGLSSLYSAATPTNIDPISQINSIGVCKTSASNNLFLMWNDATGTASSLDTGFTGISNTFTYTLRIFKTFGIASVTIELTQITNSTGATSVFSTTITSDYNTGVNHFPVAWMGNSTSSTGAVSYKDYGCTMTKRNIITA